MENRKIIRIFFFSRRKENNFFFFGYLKGQTGLLAARGMNKNFQKQEDELEFFLQQKGWLKNDKIFELGLEKR